MSRHKDEAPKTVDRALYAVARDEVLRKISIPDYVRNHVDNDIDLTYKDSCLCPFHEENTPSFRYNRAENYWRCFGKCKDGGTVIELHARKFGFTNHYEALENIKKKFGKMYGLEFKDFMFDATDVTKTVADILRDKAPLSAKDFLGENAKETLTTLIPKIEAKLIILRGLNKDAYILACLEFDSLYSAVSLTEPNAKTMLDKIEKAIKHFKTSKINTDPLN